MHEVAFHQNLPPRLESDLFDIYPDSQHVQSVGLARASDSQLWSYARNNHFVVVTKDADFSDRSAIEGHPPKIVWIRIGNSTTSEIESALRKNHKEIIRFEQNDNLGVLALF